ncbi:outer membrane protein assembly factor BamA [Gammaproteobacteria bacterium]|nr:outer membrane protein assembly factor BamA [Gammaproteobacteria bacterium]
MVLKTFIHQLGMLMLMGVVSAEVIEKIDVQGLDVLNYQQIQPHIEINVGEDIDDEAIRSQIRTLYQTGFFNQVRVDIQSGLLIIALQEQPVIHALDVESNGIPKDGVIKEMSNQGIEVGELFNESKFAALIAGLRGTLDSAGFKNADVDISIEPYGKNGIDVKINIVVKTRVKLKEVHFSGEPLFSDYRLKSQLRSRQTNILSFLFDDDLASEMALEQDRKLLTHYYQSHGYLDVQVAIQVDKAVPKQRIWTNEYLSVTYHIAPGKQYKVRDAFIEDALDVMTEAHKSQLVGQVVDHTFSKEKIEKAMNASTEKLNEGKRRFVIASDIQPVGEAEVDIHLKVLEVKSKVRFIHFVGNYNTKDFTLRKNIELRENQLFIEMDLVSAARALQGLHYIQGVTYKIQPVADDVYDIFFEVTEVDKGSFNIGGNGGFQNGSLNASVFMTDTNFLGSGDSLSINASLSGPTQSAQVGYSQPNYAGTGASRSVNLSANRTAKDDEEETNYSSDEYAVSGNWSYPIVKNVYAGVSGSFTRMEFTNVDKASSLVQDYFGNREPELNLLNVGASLRYSNLDNYYDPRQGVSFSTSVSSTLPIDNAAKYYNLQAEARGYYELGQAFDQYFIFRSRAMMSYTEAYDDDVLPFFARKYAGGMGTVRGYDNGMLGEKYLDKIYATHDDGTKNIIGSREKAKGGGVLVVGNAEIKMPSPMPELVTPFLFVDVGNVYETPSDIDLSLLRGSAGITFSAMLPVVAAEVSLSIAVPFNEGDENFETISFGFGKMF